jgi:hypothetical protein
LHPNLQTDHQPLGPKAWAILESACCTTIVIIVNPATCAPTIGFICSPDAPSQQAKQAQYYPQPAPSRFAKQPGGVAICNKWALQTVEQSRAVAEPLLSTQLLAMPKRRWHSQTNNGSIL